MLLSYFAYSCVHLKQKVRLRPELSRKFLSNLGPNPARTRAKPDPKSPARLTTRQRTAFENVKSVKINKIYDCTLNVNGS